MCYLTCVRSYLIGRGAARTRARHLKMGVSHLLPESQQQAHDAQMWPDMYIKKRRIDPA